MDDSTRRRRSWHAAISHRSGAQGDIVSLGMISGLVIKGGHVGFMIEIDPGRGKALEPLRQEAERVVQGLPGVSPAPPC